MLGLNAVQFGKVQDESIGRQRTKTVMTFDELAASRRKWIDEVLKPWCRQAARKELKQVELEWDNLAGSVDTEATLWSWAWSRFPQLVHEGLSGVDESHEVTVTLIDGSSIAGYPDGRKSQQGMLILLCAGATAESGPYSIDEIATVERL
jgi:hypothetical protein